MVNLKRRELAVVCRLRRQSGIGRGFGTVADAMDLAIRARRAVQVDAELGQRRRSEQGYEASQQFDQRLHVRYPRSSASYA
jgi:hypothetical protein